MGRRRGGAAGRPPAHARRTTGADRTCSPHRHLRRGTVPAPGRRAGLRRRRSCGSDLRVCGRIQGGRAHPRRLARGGPFVGRAAGGRGRRLVAVLPSGFAHGRDARAASGLDHGRFDRGSITFRPGGRSEIRCRLYLGRAHHGGPDPLSWRDAFSIQGRLSRGGRVGSKRGARAAGSHLRNDRVLRRRRVRRARAGRSRGSDRRRRRDPACWSDIDAGLPPLVVAAVHIGRVAPHARRGGVGRRRIASLRASRRCDHHRRRESVAAGGRSRAARAPGGGGRRSDRPARSRVGLGRGGSRRPVRSGRAALDGRGARLRRGAPGDIQNPAVARHRGIDPTDTVGEDRARPALP